MAALIAFGKRLFTFGLNGSGGVEELVLVVAVLASGQARKARGKLIHG